MKKMAPHTLSPVQLPRHREWPIYLVLLSVTVAIFWPVNHYEFVNYDDVSYVMENPHIQQGLTPGHPRLVLSGGGGWQLASHHLPVAPD